MIDLKPLFERIEHARQDDTLRVDDELFAALLQYVPPTEVNFQTDGYCVIRWGGRYGKVTIIPYDEEKFRAAKSVS